MLVGRFVPLTSSNAINVLQGLVGVWGGGGGGSIIKKRVWSSA